MQELAEVEDAATEAAFNAAHQGDQVPPPVAKAPQVAQEPAAAAQQFKSMIHRQNQLLLQGMSIQKSESGQSSSNFQLESMVLLSRTRTLCHSIHHE